MSHDLIVVCKYGWGQFLRLYRDHLELNETSYAIQDIISIQPIYARTLGISSTRLKLQLKERVIFLRGIVDIDAALKIIVYVESWQRAHLRAVLQNGAVSPSDQSASHHLHLDAQAWIPVDGNEQAKEASEALNARMYQERQMLRIHRLNNLRTERTRRQHGFDVERLTRTLQSGQLPHVIVTPRLHQGEVAHYCVDAQFYTELSGTPLFARRGIKDQGQFILTNQRAIYMGRKRQIVIKYEQLLHFFCQDELVVLLTLNWTNRYRFSLRYPLECLMYLETIFQRFQQENMPLALPWAIDASTGGDWSMVPMSQSPFLIGPTGESRTR
ncbi:hypothetical protein [Tengunoibacter tsumagoiensis]|uniref:Uncharacterized protein n=1 Tax=Tengunoibacter tsumagoiensis TaxID=2014871 RepID=A0A402A4V0_9CHLR|nr:hypothetical protein [Tengunoibacter tsumagoiensis]GCE14031.1 hypothetical protein KTT_38900 [Tengunoibacter tsumagoiensis]